MKKHDPSQYYQSYLYMGYVWFTIVLIMLFLTSCSGTYYVVEQPYEDPHYEHTTQVYYYNDLPYWGMYNNYYYYYGIPHTYPWWYYYTLMPHYTYSVHTHVFIHCDNGYYVSKPRGAKFNNRTNRVYKPNRTVIKSNRPNRPIIKTNTNRTNVKVNTNRNRTNVKVNTNRNRTNSNKVNNKTYNNRSNKTNNRKNTRKPR